MYRQKTLLTSGCLGCFWQPGKIVGTCRVRRRWHAIIQMFRSIPNRLDSWTAALGLSAHRARRYKLPPGNQSLARSVRISMQFRRPQLLTSCLVWTAALGLSCTALASRPICTCWHEVQEHALPVCPHCSQVKQHECCQQVGNGEDDCECPCCLSTPADQPLRLDSANQPLPEQLSGPALLETSFRSISTMDPAVATRGWRYGQLVGYDPPRLATLCRWNI